MKSRRRSVLNKPEVFAVVKVPGGGVTHDLTTVGGFLNEGVVPELRRHRLQPERLEEIIR